MRTRDGLLVACLLIVDGLWTVAFGLVGDPGAEPQYYLEVERADDRPGGDDAEAATVEDLSPETREAFLAALDDEYGSAPVGSERPEDYPRYVRHDGRYYELALSVGDPGDPPVRLAAFVVGLAVLGLGVGGRLLHASLESEAPS